MTEHYLGIDVGYSKSKNTTGLCLITLEQGCFKWRCRNTGSEKSQRLAHLRELIPEGASISAVGIDGPLASDFQLVSHYRAADALLTRDSFQKRCKPGNTNSPTGQRLHCHATKLAKLVIELKEEGYLHVENASHPDPIHWSRVVEVFPDAFLGVLFPDRHIQNIQLGRGKSDRFWETAIHHGLLKRLIRHLDPQIRLDKPLHSVVDHDHRAAFVCALAGLCVARNKYVSVGDPEDGSIYLPPFDVWGRGTAPAKPPEPSRWGKTALQNNLRSVRRNPKQRPNHDQGTVFYNSKLWYSEL